MADLANMTETQPLNQHDARRIAVEAECHPATVERYWSGRPVRQLSERRIVRALKALGIQRPVRAA